MGMGTFNYYNYFTEIEEYFWRKRGAHLLVSPLDWALVESWQKAGISLAAVLKGIDRAFESYARSRRGAGGRKLKSLVYCMNAVLDAAEDEKQAAAGCGPQTKPARMTSELFSRDELRAYFKRNGERLARVAEKLQGTQREIAGRLSDATMKLAEMMPLLDPPGTLDLEELERRLTVLEQKLTAALTSAAPEEVLVAVRREMDRHLRPYRRKMSAAQLDALERQYTQKRLFEAYDVPRLSLFYLT